MSGAEVADGVEECRKAVRRQVGAGTDWIKVCVMGLLSVFLVSFSFSFFCAGVYLSQYLESDMISDIPSFCFS